MVLERQIKNEKSSINKRFRALTKNTLRDDKLNKLILFGKDNFDEMKTFDNYQSAKTDFNNYSSTFD
jgi:hypothetical protein